jgi:hypothetical protein
MSGKNTAVFGLYPDETELVEVIEQLKEAGFRMTDLSMLLPRTWGQRTLGTRSTPRLPRGPSRAASPERSLAARSVGSPLRVRLCRRSRGQKRWPWPSLREWELSAPWAR